MKSYCTVIYFRSLQLNWLTAYGQTVLQSSVTVSKTAELCYLFQFVPSIMLAVLFPLFLCWSSSPSFSVCWSSFHILPMSCGDYPLFFEGHRCYLQQLLRRQQIKQLEQFVHAFLTPSCWCFSACMFILKTWNVIGHLCLKSLPILVASEYVPSNLITTVCYRFKFSMKTQSLSSIPAWSNNSTSLFQMTLWPYDLMTLSHAVS